MNNNFKVCRCGAVYFPLGTAGDTCGYPVGHVCPLDEPLQARVTDPQSSQEAAKAIRNDEPTLFDLIEETMEQSPTCLSALMVSEITDVGIQTISPRFKRMWNRLGRIAYCGKVVNSTGRTVDGYTVPGKACKLHGTASVPATGMIDVEEL